LLFNSYVFLFVFLPVVLAGFFLAARLGRRAAGGWLVVSSFVFYGWWNPAFCLLLSVSILFNYSVSLLLVRTDMRQRRRNLILGLGVAANLSALVYFKYLAWLIGLVNAAFASGLDVPSIVLPLGISFFTFTQIGYLIDCAAGVARDRSPLNYVLFVTFFPHLIAGPILHNQDIMPQFAAAATYRWSSTNFAVGMGIFVLGLLKKSLLADRIGVGLPAAFAHPGDLPLFAAWHAVLAYSLQLYFDFSGYSDMAIGAARMFNVTLPVNFNSPYKSAGIIEFWQRWHMSLTRYLMQYVYTPLALWVVRRRQAKGLPINGVAQRTVRGFCAMVAMPVVVTMTLAGIWHGSGAQFLVFGLIHATMLCINRGWRMAFGPPTAATARGWVHAGKVLLTYLCVSVAVVFFRAPSLDGALTMLGGLMGLHGVGPALPVPQSWLENVGMFATLAAHGVLTGTQNISPFAQTMLSLEWYCCFYAIVWLMPNTQQIFVAYAPVLERIQSAASDRFNFRLDVPWAIAIGCAGMLGVLTLGGSSEFLYFQF